MEIFSLMPHGYCLSWRPSLVAAFVISNGLIALAYFSIPFFIFNFVRKRPDIEFKNIHWLFAAFILACGITHLMHIAELWWPIYYFESVVDIATAAISVVATIVVWKLLPTLIAFPSINQLQALNEQLVASEKKVRQSEALMRTIADSLPDSYLYEYTIDASGTPHFLHLSSGVERLNGVSREAVLKDAYVLINQIDPAQMAEYKLTEATSHRNQTDFSMDLRMRRPDGEWRWFRAHARPRQHEDGQLVWDGLTTDITDRQLYEGEINRLAQAIEQNPTAILIINADGQLEYANSAYTRATGYQFGEIYAKPRRELFSSEVSDEDFARIEAQIISGKPWHGVLANRHKDGRLYWEEITASTVYDHRGQLTHHLYTRQDVTEREKMLQEIDLSARVLSVSNEAVMVSDTNNRVVSINPAFTRITGYEEADVLGQDPKMLASGRHDKAFYESMWHSVRTKGEWSGEIWNRRKDGSVYPEWLSIATFTNKADQVQNYVAIFSDITSRKAVEEKIQRLAHYDPLTNLPNRTLLHDRVKTALAMAQRHKNQVALMYLDLDRFKNINDSLGHHVGDALLEEVAKRLTNLLREEDTVSRIGGDEFVIVLPGTEAHGAANVANKVLYAIAESFHYGHHELNIGVSIGIALYPDNGEDFAALSQAADSALYRAKTAGRNNFQFFTEELHARARNTLRLESALRHAVTRGEMQLYYQPQFNMSGDTIIGAEALLRWQNPELGWVSPGEFIPIAEESGLILEIGSFVLRTAIRQQAEWLRAGLPVVPVAVNLSLAQFRQASLCDEIAGLLVEYNLPANLLELELTESMAMEDVDYVIQTVDRLAALGIALSIDDFGTGYSSLSYLKRFRVHKLKIDQSFIRDIMHDADDEAIVSAIISMAISLKFRVIAEGVETAEQLATLLKHGCHEVQGFYFSKPLPADSYAARLTAATPIA